VKQDFFVGIGAQKAGTTWLARYLSKHPEVGFSPIKELHYFDSVYRQDMAIYFNRQMIEKLKKAAGSLSSDSFPNMGKLRKIRLLTLRLEMIHNESKYQQYFAEIAEESHRVVGEITPSYSLLDSDGFASISRVFPGAKFIFMMRDPVSRFWSHLRFRETRKGHTAANSIEKCLKNEQFLMRTDYKRTLTELFKVVPEERVHVVFFENLISSDLHEKTLRSITDFLRISYIPGDIGEKKNVSKSVPLDDKYKPLIAQKFSHVYEYVAENYPNDMPEKWKQSMTYLD
jgi:hypothetical protein